MTSEKDVGNQSKDASQNLLSCSPMAELSPEHELRVRDSGSDVANEARVRIPLNLILMYVFGSIRDHLSPEAKPLVVLSGRTQVGVVNQVQISKAYSAWKTGLRILSWEPHALETNIIVVEAKRPILSLMSSPHSMNWK